MRVLIVGCGYVGTALGARLAQDGHKVYGLRRGISPAEALKTAGITPVRADITALEELRALPPVYDWVINCVASGGGPEAYESVYVRGNRNLVEWLSGSPVKKFVYTSSTGVYGQDDGSFVHEGDPVQPPSETGKKLVAAEEVLLAAARERSFPAVILRLAGIYGPGRGFWLKQFLQGQASMDGDGSRVLNMIHRDDVVGAILAALENGATGDICNVVDNQPSTQREVFEWLASTLQTPLPPPMPAGPAPRRRGATSKRVSNSKLRQRYGYTLKYPTFREGYSAELAAAGREAGLASGTS